MNTEAVLYKPLCELRSLFVRKRFERLNGTPGFFEERCTLNVYPDILNLNPLDGWGWERVFRFALEAGGTHLECSAPLGMTDTTERWFSPKTEILFSVVRIRDDTYKLTSMTCRGRSIENTDDFLSIIEECAALQGTWGKWLMIGLYTLFLMRPLVIFVNALAVQARIDAYWEECVMIGDVSSACREIRDRMGNPVRYPANDSVEPT